LILKQLFDATQANTLYARKKITTRKRGFQDRAACFEHIHPGQKKYKNENDQKSKKTGDILSFKL
jgi:hypothetical protein